MKSKEYFPGRLTFIDVKPIDHILEIGCGAGIFCRKIAMQLTSGTITAIDKSAPMIKMAR